MTEGEWREAGGCEMNSRGRMGQAWQWIGWGLGRRTLR